MTSAHLTLIGPLAAVLAVAAILLSPAPPVHAQDTRTLPEREQACLAVAPQLMQNSNVTSMLDAMAQLRACPDAGPRLLAARWQQPIPDQHLLQSWIVTTAVSRDERLFTAMLRIIADRSQPRVVRLAALSVATFYADQGSLILFGDKLNDGDSPIDFDGPITYLDYVMSYPPPLRRAFEGARPIAGNPKQRLVSVLQEMSESVGDDQFVSAGVRTLLHQKLGVHVRSGPPIDMDFVRSFRRNVTTMAEVQSRLGPPQLMTQTPDSVTWFYSYWEVNRPVAGFTQPRNFSQILSVTFVDGRVVNYGNRMPGG